MQNQTASVDELQSVEWPAGVVCERWSPFSWVYQCVCACVCSCPPLIAVGELHVHAVSADEGPAVHRRVDVGRVWDGFAHQDGAGERGLLEAAQPPWRAAVVHLQLSGAVQHLQGAAERKMGLGA